MHIINGFGVGRLLECISLRPPHFRFLAEVSATFVLSAHVQSLQIVLLSNRYFPNKQPKSQDEIPVLSSYGKKREHWLCHGCATQHLSQRHHSCLMMDSEDVWMYYPMMW